MSRGFGGSGLFSTDNVLTGYAGNPSPVSYFIWANRTGAGGSNLGRMFVKEGMTTWYNNNAVTAYEFVRTFSTTSGVWRVTQPSLNVWHSCGITYDESSTSNDPTIYIDGSSVSVTRTTGPVGTASTDAGAYRIGNSNATNRVWGGFLAEFAIWNVILSADEMAALNSGVLPYRVRPAAIVAQLPIGGVHNPEMDLIVANGTATVTGTVASGHAPVSPITFGRNMDNPEIATPGIPSPGKKGWIMVG